MIQNEAAFYFLTDFKVFLARIVLSESFESVTHLSLLLHSDELLTLFEDEMWDSMHIGSTLHSVRA